MTIEIPQSANLENLLMNNSEMEKKVRSIIQKELAKARSELANAAKTSVPNDPRQAYKSVRRAMYKRILGGNLNILAPKRAGALRQWDKPRKLDRNPKQRGGNRMKRSERTKKFDSYWGKDRGFILRFQNDGTSTRASKYGNRGAIASRNWFPGASHKALEAASERISQLIDDEISKTLK